jgi:hypothetical protein
MFSRRRFLATAAATAAAAALPAPAIDDAVPFLAAPGDIGPVVYAALVSKAGVEAILKWEGGSWGSYGDQTNKLTIGYGHAARA